MRTPLASAADQSAVSFRPSQGAGARRQFVVCRPTAGMGTRVACVPFGNVVSARRAIVLVVPAAGSSGRLVASVPVSRSGILSCGNDGGIEDTIDGGVCGFSGVYATIISAVNVINNGNVINQIAVI